MLARRRTVVLLSLLLSASACAELFPTPHRGEVRGRMADPQIDKTATVRRGGSDVTLPKGALPFWPAVVIPACTRSDSAVSRRPGDGSCQLIDPKADTLRAPLTATTQSRP